MLWVSIVPHIPKTSRYTIGVRIEETFLDVLEQTYIAYFSPKDHKHKMIAGCILKLDTLKFLLSVAWEGKMISNSHYEQIALKLNEVGKMFGGWQKSMSNTEKKNRSL